MQSTDFPPVHSVPMALFREMTAPDIRWSSCRCKNRFFSIPDDLIEASKVDGLSNFGAFRQIILPLSVPALVAQFVMQFVGGYNAYLGPLLYLYSPEKYTLQIALNFFKGTYSTDYSVVMAGAVSSLLPTIILYLIGQNYFLEGMATSGMKL